MRNISRLRSTRPKPAPNPKSRIPNPESVPVTGRTSRPIAGRPSHIIASGMSGAPPAPRLVVTDALGRRIVTIDKPLFTIGRRSEAELRLPGADISRVHAEIVLDPTNGCIIRDKQSRFGTFVNGERMTERQLAHGDQIRLGQA